MRNYKISTTSLRARYLLIATLIAVLIISAAVFTNWYVLKVTGENTGSLKLRDDVGQTLQLLRSEIRHSDDALYNMLFSPQPGQEESIKEHFSQSTWLIEKMQYHPGLLSAGLKDNVADLKKQIAILQDLVLKLIKLRKDPSWVYPALPYITETLLKPNIAFEQAATLALEEIEFESGSSYSTELYRDIDEIKDLWRRMILNFRAVMIRYAGLHDVDPSDQEYNIEQIYSVIHERLLKLKKDRIGKPVNTQVSDSIEKMIRSGDDWISNFEEVKKLRRSSNWRADVEFLNTKIAPAKSAMITSLNGLENAVAQWSFKNTEAIQQAASRIAVEQWMLTIVGLGFLMMIYITLDRQVFRPITHVANALTATAEESDYDELPREGAHEINKLVIAFEDMRSQVRHRQLALEHQALHDSLTGLANRALLQDRLEQAILQSRRKLTKLALLILDLDHFKEINDTLGHQVGDRLLQQVADRLKGLLRGSDAVARLGGDEFAILMQSIDLEKAETFAIKITSALDEPYHIEEHNLYVGASIGIAVYPDHGNDAQTVVRRADIAMYIAKRSNQPYAFYNELLDEHSIDHLSLVSDLRNALDMDTLSVFYQPKVNMQTDKIMGAEALLRWKHPSDEYIPPEKIVRLAEHTGMISQLTRWVMDNAIRQFSVWYKRDPSLSLSLNLSAMNLQDILLPVTVSDILRKYNVPSSFLTLEITESAVMTDPTRAREILDTLDDMGVRLSIDDFGTGFSSLGYLKLLPVDELKIDKSFVMGMLADENDEIIVRSTIDLAHNLRLQVVAEGVEKEGIWKRLKELGCDIAQGYLISKPVPGHEFELLLSKNLNINNVRVFPRRFPE